MNEGTPVPRQKRDRRFADLPVNDLRLFGVMHDRRKQDRRDAPATQANVPAHTGFRPGAS